MDSPSPDSDEVARNVAAVKRGWETFNSTAITVDAIRVVGDVHTEVREIGAAGDKVVTVCRQSGSGIVSGVVVTWDFAMILTLRDATVVRIELSGDLDEARRMVGLAPAASARVETS